MEYEFQGDDHRHAQIEKCPQWLDFLCISNASLGLEVPKDRKGAVSWCGSLVSPFGDPCGVNSTPPFQETSKSCTRSACT